jgi:hypothetical protein
MEASALSRFAGRRGKMVNPSDLLLRCSFERELFYYHDALKTCLFVDLFVPMVPP